MRAQQLLEWGPNRFTFRYNYSKIKRHKFDVTTKPYREYSLIFFDS